MDVAERFRGLADPTRLRLMNLLADGELCGCDIQYVLGLSQPNVSRHLNYLKRSGLVRHTRRGFRVFYGVEPAHAPLLDYLRAAFRREPQFRLDRQRLKAAIRNGACSMSDAPPRTRATGRSPARVRG
jgi:ArsR family transcriptional regulator